MGRLRLKEELVCGDSREDTRAEIESLQRRSEILRKQDRLLLEMVLSYGMSFNRISEIMGISSRSVSMRFVRLRKLLTGSNYGKLLRSDRESRSLEVNLVYDKLVSGIGYRQLASKYGVSEYRVRKLLKVKSNAAERQVKSEKNKRQ